MLYSAYTGGYAPPGTRPMPRPRAPHDRGGVNTADVVRLVGQTRRLLWIAAARALAAQGESVVAWSLVNRLAELRPLTPRELARAAAQPRGGVPRALADLGRGGPTTRVLDPGGRRRRRVELTPQGMRWHRRWRPVVDGATGPVLSPLRAPERRALATLLRQI